MTVSERQLHIQKQVIGLEKPKTFWFSTELTFNHLRILLIFFFLPSTKFWKTDLQIHQCHWAKEYLILNIKSSPQSFVATLLSFSKNMVSKLSKSLQKGCPHYTLPTSTAYENHWWWSTFSTQQPSLLWHFLFLGELRFIVWHPGCWPIAEPRLLLPRLVT